MILPLTSEEYDVCEKVYEDLREGSPVLGGSNSKTVSLVQSEVEALRNLLNLFQLSGNQELLSIYRKINNL